MVYVWLVIYFVLVLLPTWWWQPTAPAVLTYDLAKLFSLIGLAMLLLQPVLAARWRLVERYVGLDRLMHWHRFTGITATLLLSAHFGFFLIFFGRLGNYALLDFITPGLKFETLGGIALLALWLTVLFALIRKPLQLPYHWWRRLHLFGYGIIMIGFIHAWFISSDLSTYPWLRAYYVGLAALTLVAATHRYIIKPWRLRRQPYTITSITEIIPGVRHIVFAGTQFPRLPGQCLFVKFFSEKVSSEWHPFTISSSPTDPAITLSIKASGDWTSSLGQLSVGDKAWLDAPYGRFSYVHLKNQRPLIYIAGGIGITPLRSMIRHCLATTPNRPQWLFYANKTPTDIAFREELANAASANPHFNLVHILSRPEPNWQGDRGHVNAALITKYIKQPAKPTDYEYFICGPKPMMQAVKKELRSLGVPRHQLHSEEFALV